MQHLIGRFPQRFAGRFFPNASGVADGSYLRYVAFPIKDGIRTRSLDDNEYNWT